MGRHAHVMSSYFFVIHSEHFRDDTFWLTVITQEFGLIKGLFKASNGRSLHLFCCYHATFRMRSSSIIRIEKPEFLPSDVYYLRQKRLFSGLYINELMFKLFSAGQEESELYLLYRFVLTQLADNQITIDPILRHVELSIFKVLGLISDWSIDFNSGDSILPDVSYTFIAPNGFTQTECVSAQRYTIKGCVVLALQETSAWSDIHILRELKHVNRRLLDFALNAEPLKSREFWS